MMAILLELLQEKRAALIAILALVVANIISFMLWTNYINPRLITSTERYENLRKISILEGKADSSTLYKRGVDDLKTLSERIPTKRQFPQLLSEIMELASSNSVTVGTMNYKPEQVKEDNLLEYSVTLSVTGKYSAIKSFLGDMLLKKEMLVIEEPSFANSDPFEEAVSLNLKMTIYLQNKEGV